MVEIIISEEWREEFEDLGKALFYVNALLELMRRQCPNEIYPEKFNTLEEFKQHSKQLLGENVEVQYYEFEYLFNVLVMEGIIFECDDEAIYIKKVRISNKPAVRKYNDKFDMELIYENNIINKKEIEDLICKNLSKYPVIKV